MSSTEQEEPEPTCSSLTPKATTGAEPKQPYLVVAKSIVDLIPSTNSTDASSLVLCSWKLKEREDVTLSSVTSHDRMETLSNVTHMENESVVSSWVDDDDCFMASAMQDIRVVAAAAPDAARVPLGKGWKIASSNNANQQRSNARKPHQQSRRSGSSQGGSQQSAMASTASGGGGGGSANAPSAAISCGRFDALASEPKRRR